MSEETKNKVLSKINEIKTNIENFIAEVNLTELKASLNTLVKDAQQDLNNKVQVDLENLKKKLQKERADIEKKAKKFLDGHRKELSILQTKLDQLIKKNAKLKTKSKSTTAKTPAAPTSKKSVKKKVAKSIQPKAGFTPKPAARKTTTKKPTARNK